MKIKTLDTLIPLWRMMCNLKSFGASEEEVRDFGPKKLSLWHFLLCQWCQCGHLQFILWLVAWQDKNGYDRYSWCGLDFVSGGSTQLQAVRRLEERVGRRIVQKSKNYLR